jgi:hypothetical protein
MDRKPTNLTEALAVFLRQLYTFLQISSSFTAILTFSSTRLNPAKLKMRY